VNPIALSAVPLLVVAPALKLS